MGQEPIAQVREAGPGDLEGLRSVFRRASLANEGDRAQLLAHPEALVFPSESIATGRTRVAVAPGGEVLGFVTTRPTDGSLELDDLFVDPAWMRHGIGSRLVDDALLAARDAGIGAVYVTANPHAMAFYEAVGFVVEGRVETEFGPGVRLRRDVGP